jgi:LemA protein
MRRSRFSLTLLLGLVGLVGLSSGCSYNRLQTLDEQINAAQGQIKVQLQRRADLIGNLVATVKGITKQEDSVFIGIANARAKLAGAAAGNDVQAMAEANAATAAPLSRLLALQENYPTLKSADNFKQLQDEIAGTENRIAVARTDYNTAVKDFNTKIRQFPTNITAKMFGLGKERPYFDVTTPDAANAPKVDFSKP